MNCFSAFLIKFLPPVLAFRHSETRLPLPLIHSLATGFKGLYPLAIVARDALNRHSEFSPAYPPWNVMKTSFLLYPLALGLLALSACGDVTTDPTYGDKAHDDLYKNGSLISDKGGFNLFGGDDKKKVAENTGIGVNGFLWRASLDTVSFMPIASADPFGGVILTDWYTSPDAPGERSKLNIFIRDRELTSDGVKVSVFRQTKDAQGQWQDATVAAATAGSLENAILTRARQLRIAQKQFN